MHQLLASRAAGTAAGLSLLFCSSAAIAQQPDAAPHQDPHDHGATPHVDEGAHGAEQYAFEWGGVFALPEGAVKLLLQPGPDEPAMKVALVAVAGAGMTDFEAVLDPAQHAFEATPAIVVNGGSITADGSAHQLTLLPTPMTFSVTVQQAGLYALFTEHMPWEFKASLVAAGTPLAPVHVRQFRTQEVRLTAVAVKTSGLMIGRATERLLTASVVVPARVSFNQEAMAHVGSPLKGWVKAIQVRLGDTVEQGQPLLIIESPELGEAQSDYLLKRTAAEAAGPAVDLAKNGYERADALYRESQGLSLTEVQRRELEYRAAQAAKRSAESMSSAAENLLHLLGMNQEAVNDLVETGEITPFYTRIAPLGGTVVEREVTLGELVSPDKEALLVLADMTTLWVLADVPEARMREVHLGDEAIVSAVGSAMSEIEGVVSYISPIVDLTTRSVQVRIVVDRGASGLRAGMFARVDIKATSAGDGMPVLAIPEEAVQRIDGQASVFVPVPGEADTFAKRLVLIGDPIGALVPVRSGLVAGEAIVIANSFILKAELGKSGAQHEH